MRFRYLVLMLLLIAGCSSGGGVIPQDNATDARISLSAPYTEDGDSFVNIEIDGAPSLYQFSMRFEFDPECVEFIGFEPSRDFGQEPIMLCERVRDIPSDLKADMLNPKNGLIAIAVSRKDPSRGDIEKPKYLGRLRYRLKCRIQDHPFRIFDRDDYLVFRNRLKNRIRVRLHELEKQRAGEQP